MGLGEAVVYTVEEPFQCLVHAALMVLRRRCGIPEANRVEEHRKHHSGGGGGVQGGILRVPAYTALIYATRLPFIAIHCHSHGGLLGGRLRTARGLDERQVPSPWAIAPKVRLGFFFLERSDAAP